MPLVTANQYDLVPQFSNIGTGFAQGAQIGNQFRQNRLQDEALAAETAKQSQINQFAQAAMGGDKAALGSLAGVDPQRANQLQTFLSGVKEEEALELNRENKVLTQTALEALGLPEDQVRPYLMQKREEFKSDGRDTSNIDRALAADDKTMVQMTKMQAVQGKELSDQFDVLYPDSVSSAQSKEFKMLTEGLSEKDKAMARRIELGLDPRAVGSATQTITEKGTATDIAKTEATIEGAKEEAKLIEQKKLKPEIESAVVRAVSQAKADADVSQENRSNDKALNLYETAIGGLIDALSGTTTGKFVGWAPAFTSNQQIADGAVAAMAPVLKQLFRGAGEGSFSDSDQALLLAMVPTRSDSPRAIQSKLDNIDAIVRAKLGKVGVTNGEGKQKIGRFTIEVSE